MCIGMTAVNTDLIEAEKNSTLTNPADTPVVGGPSSPVRASTVRVEHVRKNIVESVQEFHGVVLNNDGNIVAAAGRAAHQSFVADVVRPVVISAFLADADFSDDEWAIASSTHQGLPGQTFLVNSILAKANLTARALQCGIGDPQERLRHPDSGFHAALLYGCVRRGWSVDGYTRHEHPLHKVVVDLVLDSVGFEADDVPVVVDGSGLSTFALDLVSIGRLFRRTSNAVSLGMRSNPQLVGGIGSDDTELMMISSAWTAKTTPDGLFVAANQDGTTIVVKAIGGTNRGMRSAVSAVAGLADVTLTYWEVPQPRNSALEIRVKVDVLDGASQSGVLLVLPSTDQ
jgi:L-asparaginase II